MFEAESKQTDERTPDPYLICADARPVVLVHAYSPTQATALCIDALDGADVDPEYIEALIAEGWPEPGDVHEVGADTPKGIVLDEVIG